MKIIKATKADTQDLGAILGTVFKDHPLYMYMVDDQEKRHRMAKWVNQRVIAFGLMYGTVLTDEDKNGACVIIPTDGGALTIRKLIRVGLLQAPFKIGWSGFRKLMKFSSQIEVVRKQHMQGEHYLQLTVGVNPEMQGNGLGSALLQAGIELAESAGQDAYAETVLDNVVGWYDKHGYKTVGETKIDNVGTLYSMVRSAGN